MDLKSFKSLIDLFFYQAANENSNTIFLEWLNPKNKTGAINNMNLEIERIKKNIKSN